MKTPTKISIVLADITTQEVEAIVNAANPTLLGGGGVDGAIHKAAGPQLLEECKTLNGCETGEAKITKGYNLPAKYVIHTVGPVWKMGVANEAEMLSRCYYNSLRLAVENNLKTIAFPSISTGIYGYPNDRAAEIALAQVMKFAVDHPSLTEIRLVCFDNRDFKIYKDTYDRMVLASYRR